MKRLMFRVPLMDAAGGEGGGGAQGQAPASGQPGGGAAAQAQPSGQPGGEGGGKPLSAAAQLAGGSAAKGQPSGQEKDVDLAKTSDEDYAKLVQPDVEGQEVDRSLITPMAKELREAGIQPHVMSKVAAIYRKVVAAEMKRADEAREANMKEARDKCLAEISDEEGRDFAAAYREHISKDAFLKNLIDHTELGCSPAFIRLIALAGATLRVEKGAPASAAAGSSLHDTDQGVFEATVPQHLR